MSDTLQYYRVYLPGIVTEGDANGHHNETDNERSQDTRGFIVANSADCQQ